MTTAGSCRRVGDAATGTGAALTGTGVAVGVTDGIGVAVRVRVGARVGVGVTVGLDVALGETVGLDVAVGLGVADWSVARASATSGVGVTFLLFEARIASEPPRSARQAATTRAAPRRFRTMTWGAARMCMAPL